MHRISGSECVSLPRNGPYTTACKEAIMSNQSSISAHVVNRQCSLCSLSKPLESFCKDNRLALGRSFACHECFNARRKAARAESSIARLSSPPIVDGVNFVQLANFPEYWVGSDGSVWSRRLSNGRVRKNIYRLAGKVDDGGYVSVLLYDCDGAHSFHVHRLVLESFVGLRPDGTEALHRDGDRQNNVADNLRWGTHSENALDQRRHGTGRTQILSAEDVAEMKAERASGSLYREIAESRGVHFTTAHDAINGRTWNGA